MHKGLYIKNGRKVVRVTYIARCIPIPQGSLLFWSEFAEAFIEYRYNYLFTHESRTGTSTEVCASVQGAKIQKLWE